MGESLLSYVSRQEWFRPLVIAILAILAWEVRSRRQQEQQQGRGISTSRRNTTEQEALSRKSRLLDQFEREQQQHQQQDQQKTVQKTETQRGKDSQDDNEEDHDKDGGRGAGGGGEIIEEDNEQGLTTTTTTTTTSRQNDTTRSSSSKKTNKNGKSNIVPSSSSSSPAAVAVASASVAVPSPPPIRASTNHHPGMEGFHYWYDVECSLFRIYTLGRCDDVEVIPPYTPHSHRGQVNIMLHVTNRTNSILKVFWVDYKGKHIDKGTLRPNDVWTQTTYIDHPWVFEQADTQIPVLYYVPYKVIPTLPDIPTVSDDGIGRHQFAIIPPKGGSNSPYWISVDDKVMPHPASDHFPTPVAATSWTLQHMSRIMTLRRGVDTMPEVITLLKYLSNIVDHPEMVKYRQLRIASKTFSPIWQSPLRGLLLAIGFVDVGMYAELGCHSKPLSPERIQDVGLLAYQLREWQALETQQQQQQHDGLQGGGIEQPLGADGFGRAGWGRAG